MWRNCAESWLPLLKRRMAPAHQRQVGFISFVLEDFHKIGKANHVGRRSYEIGLQLPEAHEIVSRNRNGRPVWH